MATKRNNIMTWIGAAATCLTGWAVLYVVYSFCIPYFDQMSDMALEAGTDPRTIATLRLFLVIALLIIGLVLFIYVLLVALRVEYDQYQSY